MIATDNVSDCKQVTRDYVEALNSSRKFRLDLNICAENSQVPGTVVATARSTINIDGIPPCPDIDAPGYMPSLAAYTPGGHLQPMKCPEPETNSSSPTAAPAQAGGPEANSSSLTAAPAQAGGPEANSSSTAE